MNLCDVDVMCSAVSLLRTIPPCVVNLTVDVANATMFCASIAINEFKRAFIAV